MNQSKSSLSDSELGTTKFEQDQTSNEPLQPSSLNSGSNDENSFDQEEQICEEVDLAEPLDPSLSAEDPVEGEEDDSDSWETEEDSDEELDENSAEDRSLSSDSSSLLSDTATESNSMSTDYSETDGSLSSLISDTNSNELSDEFSSDYDDDDPYKKKDEEFSLSSMQFAKLIFGVKHGEEGDAKFVRNYAVILWGRNHLAKSSVPGVEPDPTEKPRPPLDKKRLDHLKKEWFYYKVVCENMGKKTFDEADVKKREEKIDGILGELVRELAKQRRLRKKGKSC